MEKILEFAPDTRIFATKAIYQCPKCLAVKNKLVLRLEMRLPDGEKRIVSVKHWRRGRCKAIFRKDPHPVLCPKCGNDILKLRTLFYD